jgi:hypothetical protein
MATKAKPAVEEFVLIIRTCKADGTSYNGFKWPESGLVECPDWDPKPECGNGLHGLMWGDGDWSLINNANDAKWQVVKVSPADIVKIDDSKVKFRKGEVVFTGGMAEAVTRVLADRWHIEKIVEHGLKEKSPATASGRGAKAASSGNYSTAASSGDYSKAASSGDSSTAASSGNYSTAASSGDYSKAASSGDSSKAASSGDSSTAASSGNYSTAASSGDYSKAASSGDSSTAASSGNYSTAASSGDYSKAASSGDSSKAASSGDSSTAASSGNYSTASAKGKDTIAMAAGSGCVVSAGENGCFATAYYDDSAKRYRILVGYVGEDGVKPETPYEIRDGKLQEVK